MILDERYYSKLYGGWIGKVIGVIHGANIEGWTYERIKESFGNIETYPVTFRNFCADDDINGPMLYLRALEDYHKGSDITVQELAENMLNYVGDGHGFFWWGGYGISTEHTAYENLLSGIPAPESGSILQNGSATAEQIGGQIFSDCWGLVFPGRPEEAAAVAEKMASVTHDRNGIYGARFISACISQAFLTEDMESIIRTGLSMIPADSEYARMAEQVITVCKANKEDWEKSFHYVKDHYGYQHYEGSCHIIPNAAVILLSLIHGEGSFSKTINIANMCGWDTDCNVGNLGVILGVRNGIEGIEEKWLPQVHDFVCASGSLGFLNIQTISQMAAYCARITFRIYQIEPDEVWRKVFDKEEGAYFHFEFPTAIHAMRTRSVEGKKILVSNTTEEAYHGMHSLKVVSPWTGNGDSYYLYYKPYYRPEDFDDSRYDPDFSPTVYPGDCVKAYLKGRQDDRAGSRVRIVPYYRDRITGEMIYLREQMKLLSSEWEKIEFRIPAGQTRIIEELGFYIVCAEGGPRERQFTQVLYLDDFEIIHHADYSMELEKLPLEKWDYRHIQPAHLSYLRGMLRMEEQGLSLSGSGKPAECYTGNPYWDNYEFTAVLIPIKGERHNILFRVRGGIKCFAVGLAENQTIRFYQKENNYQILDERPYPWEHGARYEIKVIVIGRHITVWVNNQYLFNRELEATDERGCIGFGNDRGSRTVYVSYELKELPRIDYLLRDLMVEEMNNGTQTESTQEGSKTN